MIRASARTRCSPGRSWVMYSSVPRVSKPGNSGGGRRLPVASNHSEDGPGRMRMPWRGHRVVVGDALGVVPHPVAVDDVVRRRFGDADFGPSTCAGTPESSCSGTRPIRGGQFLADQPCFPPIPPLATITASGPELEVAHGVPGRRDAAGGIGGSSTVPRTPMTAPFSTISSSTRCRWTNSTLGCAARPVARRCRRSPSCRCRGDVETGHRVAVPAGVVAAPFAPADEGEDLQPALRRRSQLRSSPAAKST